MSMRMLSQRQGFKQRADLALEAPEPRSNAEPRPNANMVRLVKDARNQCAPEATVGRPELSLPSTVPEAKVEVGTRKKINQERKPLEKQERTRNSPLKT